MSHLVAVKARAVTESKVTPLKVDTERGGRSDVANASNAMPDSVTPDELALLGALLLILVVLLLLLRALVRSWSWRKSCLHGFQRAATSEEDTHDSGVPSGRESRESREPPSPRCKDEDYAHFCGAGAAGRKSASDSSSSSSSRRAKTHIFLIREQEYFQKLAKLNPRSITGLPALHATIQELFAHELCGAGDEAGGAGGAASDPKRSLHVSEMELQFLDVLGAPVLVTTATPISSVLSSSALMLSDRPVADLVANGCHSDDLHAASCDPSSASSERKKSRKKARRQLGGSGHTAPRLLGSASHAGARTASRRMIGMIAPAEGDETAPADGKDEASTRARGGDVAGAPQAAGDDDLLDVEDGSVAVPAAFFRMHEASELDPVLGLMPAPDDEPPQIPR